MGPTRWGILSAGRIANDFCVAISTLGRQEHELVAVGARSLESAQKFAKTHEIPNAYGSYEELLKDNNIDVVYISSIHPHHLRLAKLALDNGKPVLCEKPLCMNVKETKELVEYARSKNLFLMEALCSRFFPAYAKLKEEIANGSIGDVLQVMVAFGCQMDQVDRIKFKELGGGTTLDIGIYCAQFASLIFGPEKPQKILASGHLNSEGIDLSTSATLIYSKGRTATLLTHARVNLPNEGLVVGTKGTLKLEKFSSPTKLHTPKGLLEFPLPPTDKLRLFGTSQGLGYQCIEVRRCLLNGLIESPLMSHEETITVAEIMESIRKQVGVVYPQD